MATTKFKTMCLLTLVMLIMTLFSSFAFADLSSKDTTDLKSDTYIKSKYDYIDIANKGDYTYKDEVVKDIKDKTRQEIELKNDKAKIKFLDVGSVGIYEKDYKLNKDVVAFKSENYKIDSKDKLPGFTKPVKIELEEETKFSVAEVTFNLSNDDWDLNENETTMVFIYKHDDFTDDKDHIIENGTFYGVEFVQDDSLTIYVDSFSSFAVVTLSTSAPHSINHGTREITPKITLELENPDNDEFDLITQAKHTASSTYSSYGTQTTQGSWGLGGYILDEVTMPEKHVRFRYRVNVFHDGTLYTSAVAPTFDLGVLVVNTLPTSISDTSATLNGQVGDSLNGYSSLSCGFQYREKGTSGWDDTGETTITSIYSDYDLSVSGLSPGTDYEFRAYCWDARSSLNIPAWGNTNDIPDSWKIFEFTTEGTSVTDPSVETDPATSIGDTTATLNGDITSMGEESELTALFMYRKVGATSFTSSDDQERTATGTYTQSITGLDECTNYEYKARVSYPNLNIEEGSLVTFETTGCEVGETDLTTDITAYYKLDETSGTTASDEVGSNDGTVDGATWTTGKINNGLDFDGSNDYIDIAGTELQKQPPLTISAWIKIDDDSRYTIIGLGRDYGGSSGYGGLFFTSVNEELQLMRGDGSTDSSGSRFGVYTVGLNLQTGTLYHVTAVLYDTDKDIDSTDYYINGDLWTGIKITAGGSDGSITYTKDYQLIGARRNDQGLTHFFEGLIDEVGIWNRALTSDEVSDLYNSGDGLSYDDFETLAEPYTVSTSPAINIGQTQVNLVGDLTSLGSETDVNVGFQYKKTIESEWSTSSTQVKSNTGEFGVLQSGLTPDTEYEYKAFAENGDIVFGDVETFTTLEVNNPTFITTDPLSVTQDSLIMRGSIFDFGDYSEVEATFSWRNGTDGEFTLIDFDEFSLLTTEPVDFSMDLTDLELDTTYQYRMVLRVDGDTLLVGNTITTATLPFTAPIVNLVGFSDITTTSAIFKGEITNISDAQPNYKLNFLIKESGTVGAYEDTEVEVIETSLDIPYLHEEVVTGLEPNTDYLVYFKLVYTVAGTEYTELSSIGTFKTSSSDIVDPADVESFFESFTGGNKTLKFIVALVLIIGMFILGFQLTNTVIGGGIFGMFGLILSVVIGLIGVWVIILLVLMLITPFLFKLMFRSS